MLVYNEVPRPNLDQASSLHMNLSTLCTVLNQEVTSIFLLLGKSAFLSLGCLLQATLKSKESWGLVIFILPTGASLGPELSVPSSFSGAYPSRVCTMRMP